ncbi:MAG: sensor histidine kinase, partial [Candidatus Binataceae bacterium]
QLWPGAAQRLTEAIGFDRLDFAALNADGSHYSLRTVFDLRAGSAPPDQPGTVHDIDIIGELLSSADKCRTANMVSRSCKNFGWQSFDGDLKAVMACRLSVRGDTLGALVFGTGRKNSYDEADVEIASRFTDHVAVAMDRCATAASLAAREGERDTLIKALQAALRAREDFISIAAHELRTPLNTLGLRLEILRQKFTNGAPDKTPEEIANVVQQADRLATLVNNLLDCSRLAAGRLEMNFARNDLAAIVREVASRQENHQARNGGGINLDLPEHLDAMFDQFRLDQVITNLLSNAFQYGEGRPIDVRLYPVGSTARLIVRDHGAGISAKDQGLIFERFQRGERTCGSRGFGLGLFITREIVNAHGGKISVDNAPGGGAAFVVELPLAPAADSAGIFKNKPANSAILAL